MEDFVKVKCEGIIKGCSKCENLYFILDENTLIDTKTGKVLSKRSKNNILYCQYCGRPLWKSVDSECLTVVAYVRKGFKWKGNIRTKCRFCKHTTVI